MTRHLVSLAAALVSLLAARPALAIAPGDLLLWSYDDPKLIHVDRESGAPSLYFTPSGLLPRAFAVRPDGEVIFAHDSRISRLTTDLQHTTLFNDYAIDDPSAAALDGDTLYVASTATDRVQAVDLVSHEITTLADRAALRAAAGITAGSDGVAVYDLELQGDALYVNDNGNAWIWEVPLDGGPIDRFPEPNLGSSYYAHRIALSSDRLFVSTGAQDHLLELDLASGQNLGPLMDEDPFFGIGDVEYDPATHTLWVVSTSDDLLLELDADTGAVLRDIPLAGLAGDETISDIEIVPTPEPSLALAGFVALAALAARRSRAA